MLDAEMLLESERESEIIVYYCIGYRLKEAYSVHLAANIDNRVVRWKKLVLSMAKEIHTKLCQPILHSLIQGYCDVGEYEKAFKLMCEMEDYGVEHEVDKYNKLIQSFCVKAFDWKTAEKLLEEMKEKGLFLPGITRGLISVVKALEQEDAPS